MLDQFCGSLHHQVAGVLLTAMKSPFFSSRTRLLAQECFPFAPSQ